MDTIFSSSEQTPLQAIPTWFVVIVALALVLSGLGSFGILDNNEGLYAEIAREMLASHDWHFWVIPHLNGLPYMEKPPLLYWLTALSFSLFGESAWSARVVPACATLACVALLVWFGKAVQHPRAGRVAALMFVSGVGVGAMSHVLMFDMLLTALLGAALMQAYRYFREGSLQFIRWAYAFLALAVLAKGLVAMVLFGLVVVGCAVGRGGAASRHRFLRWFDPGAMAIFFIIAAPWHGVASLTEPIFAWFYFVNEHVLRFLGRREPHDYYAGAWWYYLPRMAIYLFPWSFFPWCLLSSRSNAIAPADRTLHRFLWLAWFLPLVFFSMSSAKANYYLVVVMPFAALHLAIVLDERGLLQSRSLAIPGLLIGMLALLSCVVLALHRQAAPWWTVWGLSQPQFLWLVLGGLAGLAFVAASVAWYKPKIGMLAYLTLPAWLWVCLIALLPVLEPMISAQQTAHYLQSNGAGRTVYLYRNFEEQSSLPFYLKHPVQVIDARSNDLFWGGKLRTNQILISAQQFAEVMPNQRVAVVVMTRQLKEFRGEQFFSRLKGEQRLVGVTVFYN